MSSSIQDADDCNKLVTNFGVALPISGVHRARKAQFLVQAFDEIEVPQRRAEGGRTNWALARPTTRSQSMR